jgi:hypothetical protein
MVAARRAGAGSTKVYLPPLRAVCLLVQKVAKAKNARLPSALRGDTSTYSGRRANAIALQLLRLDISAAFYRYDLFQIEFSAPENGSWASELRKLSQLSAEIIRRLESNQFASFRAKLDLMNLLEEAPSSAALLKGLRVLQERANTSEEYYEERQKDIISRRKSSLIYIEQKPAIPWTTVRGALVRSSTETLLDGLERAYLLNFARSASHEVVLGDSKKVGPDPFTAFALAAHDLMNRQRPPVGSFQRQFRRMRGTQ